MRTILIALTLITGCLDEDPGDSYVSTCGPDPTVADCYKVSAYAAYIQTTRPDGEPWDDDGTDPDPYGVIYLNGEEIGRTDTLVDLPRSANGTIYFAYWHQAVAGVVLLPGDRIDTAAYDDSGYLLCECGYVLTDVMLSYGSVGCYKEIGQFSTKFELSL